MSFETDYIWMEENEDAAQLHVIVSDSCPKGCSGPCYAISGINSGTFPVEFASIAAIPQAQRGPAVEAFYKEHFWNQWFAQLSSDAVAERVFDCAVNMGMGTAVKILQTAANSVYPQDSMIELLVDGIWGPATLHDVNACDPSALVSAFDAARVAHLKKYDANSPYLAQLIARAEK